MQASHSPHKGRPWEEKNMKTVHHITTDQHTTRTQKHKIREKIPHQTRTQYSRYIGKHHQKFGNTRHTTLNFNFNWQKCPALLGWITELNAYPW
jgi:putative NADPH-quinone reductase